MLISVITPAYRPRADFLADAYKSLCAQQMPDGWDWEWLIQLDGEGELPLPDEAAKDERVKPGSGPHGGPGTARNLALERSAGSLIRNLDADDVLPPTALAQSITVLSGQATIGWTTCRALDLMSDGSLVAFEGDPPSGPLPRGSVFDWWISHNYLLNVHPTTICIRRELLIGVGGWMALPTAEDTGMMLTASALADGWFLDDVGLHYRQHPDQITRTDQHVESRPRRRAFLVERVRAVQAMLHARPDNQPPTNSPIEERVSMDTADRVTTFVAHYEDPYSDNETKLRRWVAAANERGLEVLVREVTGSRNLVGTVEVDGRIYDVRHLGRRTELQAKPQ